MTLQTLGLDIGGANLKAAHSNGVARTVSFALWKKPERLANELASLCAAMPAHDRLAVTMTGELCDCFETKRAGVHAILDSVAAVAGATPIRVWCTKGRFLSMDAARADPYAVAAANWLALAHFVAQRFADECVLLIDTGSTTTDIVYLNHGVPEPRGFTDPERLANGELVYTGVRRTPICAVLGSEVAAEFFATMLDAYLVAGLIPGRPGDCDTADGRPATLAFAQARLARMWCADVETFSSRQIEGWAGIALQAQWRTILGSIERILANRRSCNRIVLSGSGEVLGRSMLAKYQLGTDVTPTSLAELLGSALSEAACAYAVATLAAQETPDA
jgi:(4-(4-[2-(gamma-L-glutamylamino)ethyl]phenoxymethyl)furan-2-yl)methanamine synthase